MNILSRMLALDPLSDIERAFIRRVALEGKVRVDGRSRRESRELNIELLDDPGSCIVSLGETKVLAQCSAHLCEPKPTRPNEGRLSIHFDVSPMAAPLQDNRTVEYRVDIGRLLDRVIRDSECVDLENLCLVAAEKAWEVRVDVVLLNLGGNVAECASIATVAALAHFRRPDVTIVGKEVTIHPVAVREPVSLHLYHYPYCLSFAFFEPHETQQTLENTSDKAGKDGSPGSSHESDKTIPLQIATVIVDPSLDEEACCDGVLTVGVNSHDEVCALQQRGCLLTSAQIKLCIKIACARAAEISKTIKNTLTPPADEKNRKNFKCAEINRDSVHMRGHDEEEQRE
ncbi:exosome complex component RRP45-like isoform X2 [Varroa jacobsoni]|uniref:exosome complex component RRP45-like isoform X2 n=1 Tax=Varroa jacobsoni TaxID=62625 RepID=UPI000BF366BC|nr:exosome complex component RRP45-like isoform X2 [Varroa jacobsoni]